MPACLIVAELPPLADNGQPPYLQIAAALRHAIETGALEGTSALPGVKQIADRYDVSVGTAHRAMVMLRRQGVLDMVPGRGYRVVPAPLPAAEVVSAGDADAVAPEVGWRPVMLDLVLRHRGHDVAHFSTEADPADADDLPSASRRSGCVR